MKKPSGKKVMLFLMVTPLLLTIQLIIGVFIFSDLQNIDKDEQQESKVDVYLRINTKYISNAESAQRGYLLTGDINYLQTFNIDLVELQKNEDYFKTLPDEVKTQDIKNIQRISKEKMDEMHLTTELTQTGKKDSALALVKAGAGKLMMDSIRKYTTSLRDNITNEISEKKKHEHLLFVLFLGLIAMLILFNFFLVWYTYQIIRRYTTNLEHAIDSLEEANQRMSKYNTMSYHELKTPLRSISGFAQLLKRKVDHHLDTEEKEYVAYITDNVKMMDKTINEMRNKYLTYEGKEQDEEEVNNN